MAGIASYGLILWLISVPLVALLLSATRRIFRIEFDTGRLWLGSMLISILSLVAGLGGYMLSGTLIMHSFGGGDPGLGGMLFSAIGGLIVGIVALWLQSYAFITIMKRQPVGRGRRAQAGLLVAVFAPLLLIGLVWFAMSMERPVRGAVNQMKIESYTVSQSRADELVREYGLPRVPGASYPRFMFFEKGREHYGATFNANASEPVPTCVPWREFTDMIVSEVEAGLLKSGYEVTRKQGHPKKIATDQGLENLPDIHLIGRRDGHFVCYRIPYAFTQGCAFPRITMDFGEEQYYDPNMVYCTLD